MMGFTSKSVSTVRKESDRKVANLLENNDHYPKYVVMLDELALRNINDVKIV